MHTTIFANNIHKNLGRLVVTQVILIYLIRRIRNSISAQGNNTPSFPADFFSFKFYLTKEQNFHNLTTILAAKKIKNSTCIYSEKSAGKEV